MDVVIHCSLHMKVFIVLLLVAGAVESITALVLPDCYKIPETGPCRGFFPRYYYDQEDSQCKEFIYGGCGGNRNNFETEDECYNQCGVCGDNERYNGCGTDCPLTCENYDDPPEICNLSCRIGCECEKGFVRSADGKCVKPEQCPNRQVCGENERYSECGTDCPLTCENYDNPPEICNLSCRIGCECKDGFVRRADGKCVKPKQCRNRHVCGENERYSECGTDCPLTCENYDNPPEICNLSCRIGCECKDDFVRSADGKCVRPEQCPNRQDELCGDNERYNDCGTACPLTCENYDNPPEICNFLCWIGCECEKGFVRRADGKCVMPEQCPNRQAPISRMDCIEPKDSGQCSASFQRYYYDPETNDCKTFIYGGCGGNRNNFLTEAECYDKCGVKCGGNAHYEECGKPCPLTCDNYDNPPEFCPASCVSGCQCNEGFVKKENGSCVKPEDCPIKRNVTQNDCSRPPLTGPCRAFITRYHYDPSTDKCSNFTYGGCRGNKNNFETEAECNGKCRAKCGKNEHFVDCRRRCPLTCGNYENPPACVQVCGAGGCQCKNGFVRAKNGSCVKPEKCPVKRNQTRPDCPANKEYGSFGDCPDSCYSLEHPVSACTLRLNWGCKCKDGYVLKEDKVFESECIKPEECPKDACNE